MFNSENTNRFLRELQAELERLQCGCDNFDLFFQPFILSFEECFPLKLKTTKKHSDIPPCMTVELEHMCDRKRVLYKTQREKNCLELTVYYKLFCKNLKTIITNAKCEANDRKIVGVTN